MTDNLLEAIRPDTFDFTPGIRRLQLDQNQLWWLPGDAFLRLRQLRNLRLDSNRLTVVPTDALRPLAQLEALNLGSNLLTSVTVGAFPELPHLLILLLKRNQITHIDDDGFLNVPALRALHLDDNLLTHVPIALTKLTALQELSVSGNRIKYMPGGVLQRAPGLALLELRGNPLVAVAPTAFSHLPRLRKLILSDARELTEFPNLEGTAALEILRLDRAGLQEVPASLCSVCPRLRSLDVKSNKLTKIPDLSQCKDLRVLDLASNQITTLEGRPFLGLSLLHDLLLAHNSIPRLPKDAFEGLPRLQVLDLENNGITDIHPEAFLPFTQLEDLNLGHNAFPVLPTAGLDRLLVLKVFNNAALREFPPPERFPRVQRLMLAYAYHCCAFLPLLPPDPPPRPPLKDAVIFPEDTEFDMSLWNSSLTDLWPQLQNLSKKFGSQVNELWDTFGSDFTYPGNLPAYVEEYFEEAEAAGGARVGGSEQPPAGIHCVPLPGPFLPCQDLFDWWTLRCGVWVVFLLAMLGNGTVVFVLVFSRSKMDVPRFLVCNLAAADFFMGVYLGFLAVVDASTLGEFRRFAIPWQMSAGCQLAGFLGVLSAELSVYTLAVITLERNYAITHAMHLNKRLSLRHAAYIMLCGWSFALLMALLPLLGVSDYRKFAVCLPFETTTGPASLAYVVVLMLVNGVAFLILMGCYLKMYCAIRGSQAWNSNDSRIAKRMALLVFTDFICWSPIAFFSLTAAFGLQLITLEQAKVFTVFVLPLNSCCNPFLYAILTKQFKKDCVLICKAIEESRVTRGIGRCRHSSNFSNRQTPANTNSLADRSSREQQQLQQLQQAVAIHPHACTCAGRKLLSDAGTAALVAAAAAARAGAAQGVGVGGGVGVGAHRGSAGSEPALSSLGLAAAVREAPAPRGRRPGSTGEAEAGAEAAAGAGAAAAARRWLAGRARWLARCVRRDRRPAGRRARSDEYAYQIAEIQQRHKHKQHKRASSVSSSENFSSSRSDSWRHAAPHHHCGIPMRLLDPKRRASSWLVTRKTSQDSNLSSSRNDSSGSATTASTSTWKLSRSSASSDARHAQAAVAAAAAAAAASIVAPSPAAAAHASAGGGVGGTVRPKPRLTRQTAVQHEDSCPALGTVFGVGVGVDGSGSVGGGGEALPGSPGRLTVRFLATIPSAAEPETSTSCHADADGDGDAGAGGGTDAKVDGAHDAEADPDDEDDEGATASLLGGPSVGAAAGTPCYAVLHCSPPHSTKVVATTVPGRRLSEAAVVHYHHHQPQQPRGQRASFSSPSSPSSPSPTSSSRCSSSQSSPRASTAAAGATGRSSHGRPQPGPSSAS